MTDEPTSVRLWVALTLLEDMLDWELLGEDWSVATLATVADVSEPTADEWYQQLLADPGTSRSWEEPDQGRLTAMRVEAQHRLMADTNDKGPVPEGTGLGNS